VSFLASRRSCCGVLPGLGGSEAAVSRRRRGSAGRSKAGCVRVSVAAMVWGGEMQGRVARLIKGGPGILGMRALGLAWRKTGEDRRRCCCVRGRRD